MVVISVTSSSFEAIEQYKSTFPRKIGTNVKEIKDVEVANGHINVQLPRTIDHLQLAGNLKDLQYHNVATPSPQDDGHLDLEMKQCYLRQSSLRLDRLLRGTYVHIPPKPVKPSPTPEYVALMRRLRLEEEERIYLSMIGAKPEHEDIQSVMKEVSNQISVIFNVLFSSLFSGLAVWYATAQSTTYRNRDAVRVGASLAVAILVAIAEVVLYNAYMRKVTAASQIETSTAEVKSILRKIDED